jgi:hypothetical protein
MPFFAKCENRDVSEKYGFTQQGIFTQDSLKKGQPIYDCSETTCDYDFWKSDKFVGKSQDEILEIWRKFPHLQDFIKRYIIKIGDDKYDLPKHFMEERFSCFCLLFNHSCDPNCGFGNSFVAIRDIEEGEELTIDYNCLETETDSFLGDFNCKCGAISCKGLMRFNQYRNVDWQNKYYKYCCNVLQITRTNSCKSSCYWEFFVGKNLQQLVHGIIFIYFTKKKKISSTSGDKS